MNKPAERMTIVINEDEKEIIRFYIDKAAGGFDIEVTEERFDTQSFRAFKHGETLFVGFRTNTRLRRLRKWLDI